MRIQVDQKGGEIPTAVDSLRAILGQAENKHELAAEGKVVCHLTELKRCEKILEALHGYATRTFPDQVGRMESAGQLSHHTTSYDQVGVASVETPSAKIQDALKILVYVQDRSKFVKQRIWDLTTLTTSTEPGGQQRVRLDFFSMLYRTYAAAEKCYDTIIDWDYPCLSQVLDLASLLENSKTRDEELALSTLPSTDSSSNPRVTRPAKGFFRVGDGEAIFFSNGKDAYCRVPHPSLVVSTMSKLPDDMRDVTHFAYHGVCRTPVGRGFFKVEGRPSIFWSNGVDAFCHVPSPRHVTADVRVFPYDVTRATTLRKDGRCSGMK